MQIQHALHGIQLQQHIKYEDHLPLKLVVSLVKKVSYNERCNYIYIAAKQIKPTIIKKINMKVNYLSYSPDSYM